MPDAAYSPRLRTGVVLCGSGTAGAYQAGALRALTEAGIKVDIVAAHGAGVITALAAAVDGGARLWDPAGPWTSPKLARAYRWRAALRFAGLGLGLALCVLLSPLLVLLAAAGLYALSLLAGLISFTGTSARLVGAYGVLIESLFDPPILPTILPRVTLLAVLLVAIVLIVAAIDATRQDRSRRRWRGAFWWRLLGYPLDPREPGAAMVDALWALVRGASHEPRPTAAEIGRRYVELLSDNFGQPGFHEVVLAVHDLDGRRDIVGAALAAPARAAFESGQGAGPREAGAVDFTGPQRELLAGFVHGSFRLPVVTSPAVMEFPADSFWRGERHRVCDRPELAVRLVGELAAMGVQQMILVSPAPPPAVPHTMRARPASVRARVGEVLRSVETAVLDDAILAAAAGCSGVFVVRPEHNPLGPFDFAGAYDESSDRDYSVRELMQQGYDDAYRRFVEPAAAGDRIELTELSPES